MKSYWCTYLHVAATSSNIYMGISADIILKKSLILAKLDKKTLATKWIYEYDIGPLRTEMFSFRAILDGIIIVSRY